jgi:hypothetical protein
MRGKKRNHSQKMRLIRLLPATFQKRLIDFSLHGSADANAYGTDV